MLQYNITVWPLLPALDSVVGKPSRWRMDTIEFEGNLGVK